MSILARLLVLLTLLMLALPAPLKATCCPDPAQASGQMPEVPPCHGGSDDPSPPADHAACDDSCCPCRAPAHLPDNVILARATLPPPVPDFVEAMWPAALRIPPLPPPIA